MARLHSGLADRTAYLPSGLIKAQGLPCKVYKDAAGTVLGNLAYYDPEDVDTPGSAIPGAALTVDAYSNRPAFWDLDDTEVLYLTINGGPLEPIRPDAQPQISELDDRVTAVEGGVGGAETPAGAQAKVDTHSSDTTGVHGIPDTALLETQTGAQAKATAAQAAAISTASTDATAKVTAHSAATDPHGDRAAAATDATTKANAAQSAAVSSAATDATAKVAAEATLRADADALKAPLASPAFTGTPTGITKAHVGLSAVDNVSAADLRDRSTHTGQQSADTLDDGTTKKAYLATERTKLTGVVTTVVDTALSGGAIDATAAIRAAVAAGGDVVLPAGTWLYRCPATAMTFPAGTKLHGVPGRTTINVQTTGATGPGGDYREFARNGGDNVSIEGITFVRTADFPVVWFPVNAYDGFTVKKCKVVGNRDIYTASNYSHVFNLGVQNAGVSRRIKILKSTFTKNSFALFQSSLSTATIEDVLVKECVFDSQYATDLEFNSPIGTTTGVRVKDCIFKDNQTTSSAAGFGVGLAHIADAVVRDCTFTNYNNEAVHVEDYSTDVRIRGNTLVDCGMLQGSYLQVVSGSQRVRIADNSFKAVSNSNTIFQVNVLAGGVGNTPGNRPIIEPLYVDVSNNDFTVAASVPVRGLYLETILQPTVIGNRFRGPGQATFSYAIRMPNCFAPTVTGNMVRSWTYGLFPDAGTARTPGDGVSFTGNNFHDCTLGAGLINIGAGTYTGNNFYNCVHPMILGQGTSAGNKSAVIANNNAFNCTNPFGIYGSIKVTTTGAATIGAGRTLNIAGFPNVAPSGTVITFSGGGVLTLNAVGTFLANSLTGTVSVANIGIGETATAYLPYSSDATQNRTLANNGDGFYGASGFGVRKVSTAVSYSLLGYEQLVVATAGGITVTLPPASNYNGFQFRVSNTSGSSLTLASAGGNIAGSSTQPLVAGTAVTLVSDGTAYWFG